MSNRSERPKVDHPYVFSVSQVETYLLCPRKWAYNKIDGILDPGNEASQLGGRVHDILEAYLKHGTPFDASTVEGRIALSGAHNLPTPMTPGMTVEEWFTVEIGNAVFQGLKDFENLTLPIPLVGDHKTTKNLMWAKNPDTLRRNIQAGIYAYDAHLKTGSSVVDLFWNYYKTTGSSESLPIKTQINLKEINSVVDHVAETADLMIKTKKNHERASTVEANLTGCDAFGGCPRKELCGLTPRNRLISMFRQKETEEKMVAGNSVLEKIKERAKKKAGATTPATNPPENAVAEQVQPSEPPPEEVPGVAIEVKKEEPVKEAKPLKTTRASKKKAAEAEDPAPSGNGQSRFALIRLLETVYEAFLEDVANAKK